MRKQRGGRGLLSFASVCTLLGATLAAAVPGLAGEWQVLTLNGRTAVETPVVRFTPQGGLSGTTGCNSFRGTAVFEDGDLVIDGPLATTLMACPGEALAARDDALIALFSLSRRDTIVELAAPVGTLPDLPPTHAWLAPAAGEPPYVNPFGLPDDLPIHAEPDPASDVLGGAFSGQVFRNLGCETDWCQIETPDGSVRGWSKRQYLEASDPVLRAGQGVFDAVAPVPCAIGAGAPMGNCAMGVARDGGGSATVVVTKPDGVDRIRFFKDGAFAGSDTSQAGGGFEASATRESDLTMIRVDDERYEIPDAVLFGG